MSEHQRKQIEIIDAIEAQLKTNSFRATAISPVADFNVDTRMSLTAVHFPAKYLNSYIVKEIIEPLKAVFPEAYYYSDDNLHMTIKNIRAPHDPPRFTDEDIRKAEEVFGSVVPGHTKFNVFLYRLLLFQNNLALMGTTDEELDSIIFDLDRGLQDSGIADDKKYVNTSHFFINVNIARFAQFPPEFKRKAGEFSQRLNFDPYCIDTVSLVTANSVFKKVSQVNTWNLK